MVGQNETTTLLLHGQNLVVNLTFKKVTPI